MGGKSVGKYAGSLNNFGSDPQRVSNSTGLINRHSTVLVTWVLDLPDGDNIDVVVECFVSLEGLAWPDVGIQGELFPESQVERPEPLSDRCHQRGLQTNAVLVNRVNGRLGDSHSSVSLTIKSKH